MALIASEDYVAKRIYLSVESVDVEVDPIAIYKEHRERRRLNANSERNFLPMVYAFGNEQIGESKYTPRFTNLAPGVRIVPYDTNHSLLIRGSLVSTSESLDGRDLFDRSSVSSNVDIDYQPPQVEIIKVASGGLTPEQITKLNNINTIVDRLNSLIESTATHLRFKATALEQSPDQAELDFIMATLALIKAKTDQITVVGNDIKLLLDLNMLTPGKAVKHTPTSIVVGEDQIVISLTENQAQNSVTGIRTT